MPNKQTKDILRFDFINSLPQPLFARQYGDRDLWWPIDDIEVQIATCRIDVCGKLQIILFAEIAEIKDALGNKYDPDTFYVE